LFKINRAPLFEKKSSVGPVSIPHFARI